jgi:hypothetical protein
MRNDRRVLRAAAVSTAAGALLLTAAGPAVACFTGTRATADGLPATGSIVLASYEQTTAESMGTLLEKLRWFAAAADAARVAAEKVPTSTVLTARQAVWAKAKLARAEALRAKLDALAASVPGGLTVAQAALVAQIKADLDVVVSRVSAIPDNGIKQAAVAVKPTTTKVLGERSTLRHRCDGDHDGWWGSWSGSWGDRDGTWGSRDGSWGDHDGWHG